MNQNHLNNKDELDFVFMPSLVYLLNYMEKEKGAPLSKEEVENIRDNAVCMTIAKVRLRAVEEKRGCKDIDPDNCYEEWCKYREKPVKIKD